MRASAREGKEARRREGKEGRREGEGKRTEHRRPSARLSAGLEKPRSAYGDHS